MKKQLLLFAILGAFNLGLLHAQELMITGGLNHASLKISDNDDELSDQVFNPGFHLGLNADLSINENLSFAPGFIFNTKGVKVKDKQDGISAEMDVLLNYIDIPLHLKTKANVGDDLKFYFMVGPYVGVGVNGKVKLSVSYNGESDSDSEDLKFGSDEDEYKRLDGGFSFGIGAEHKSVLFGITYKLGLANISNFQDNGYSVHNRTLEFTIGYRLNP